MSEPEGPDLLEERIVLYGLIQHHETRVRELSGLAPADFSLALHASIFSAIKALAARGDPIDWPIVALETRRADPAVAFAEVTDLVNYPAAEANLPYYVARLRAATAERDLRRVALDVLREQEPTGAGEAFTRIMEIQSRNGSNGWGAKTLDGGTYMALETISPPSIIGNGLLSKGDLGMLYGEGGRGKSFLTLQLAKAVTAASEWIGLPGPTEPMRVGLASLEIPRHAMQDRLRAVFGSSAPSSLKIISQTEFGAMRPDLLEPSSAAGLAQWIRHDQLDLVILDAFSRFWSGDEMRDAALRMAVCDEIRIATGCAILWVHHERKPANGQAADDDLAALRSSTRYQTDPTVLMRLTISRGMLVLRVAKSNFAAVPPPIYLARNPDGTLVVAASPETTSDKNRDRIRSLLEANPTGMSSASIQAATGYHKATVSRHLRALGAENVGTERAPVYRCTLQSVAKPPATEDESIW